MYHDYLLTFFLLYPVSIFACFLKHDLWFLECFQQFEAGCLAISQNLILEVLLFKIHQMMMKANVIFLSLFQSYNLQTCAVFCSFFPSFYFRRFSFVIDVPHFFAPVLVLNGLFVSCLFSPYFLILMPFFVPFVHHPYLHY